MIMTAPTKNREIVLDILLEILEKGGYSHVVIGKALEKYQYLEKQDRAFITRAAEGTVEYLITIDAVLDQCSRVPVKKMKPVIRTILRMSVYQLLWMDRVPDSAVCNEAVKLAAGRRFTGLKGYVNGVLRTVARRKKEFRFEDWSRKYSMPEWLIDKWRQQYPDPVVERMLQAFLEDRLVTVRCNEHLADVEKIMESLTAEGVLVKESPLSAHGLVLEKYDYLEKLTAFQRGWIQVQDVSSGFVGELAAPRPGDTVIDVCGAPGGKGLHIADLLNGTGLVLIRDISLAKIRLVEENRMRAGYENVQTEVWDARETDPAWKEKADVVLADLPCSGLGIIGKKPDIKYQASPEKIRELAGLQRKILTAAGSYLKPGGRLIYSTCTISREENEDQREWILKELPFTPVNISGMLGEAVAEPSMEEGFLQLLPGKYPCDGFFIAVFQKKTDE